MIEHPLRERLTGLLLQNESAVDFNLQLVDTLHVWDDLIDLDKPVSREDIHLAFRNALVLIPANAFYRQHFHQIHPLIDNLILNWLTANEMEDTQTQLDIAWVIRSDYCNVLLKCLHIVGGFDYARKVWPSVRAFWHAEGYDSYLSSLEAEQANKIAQGGTLHVL